MQEYKVKLPDVSCYTNYSEWEHEYRILNNGNIPGQQEAWEAAIALMLYKFK
jgi:hypothetical protein